MWGWSSRIVASGALRGVPARCAGVLLLLAVYHLSFAAIHGAVGNPAFLIGVIPCLIAAYLLGIRGALVVVLLVQLSDRSFAHAMPGAETSVTAAVIAVLSKLLVAGG